jgi:ribosomal protein S18 acetylase RimI-like enzyme
MRPADARWRISSGLPHPETVERLLRLLPAWFGIESANAAYLESARHLPTYLAWPRPGPAKPEPVGVLLATRHFPSAAEIHLMAVDPSLHRQGVGRALVTALETDLIADKVKFLQVKTLGPSSPDESYAQTRSFYAGLGFEPLEELHNLWPANPCLIMIKSLPPHPVTLPPP